MANDIYVAPSTADSAAAAAAAAATATPSIAASYTYSHPYADSALYQQSPHHLSSPYQSIYSPAAVENRYFSSEYLARYSSLTTYYPEYATSPYIAGNSYFDVTNSSRSDNLIKKGYCASICFLEDIVISLCLSMVRSLSLPYDTAQLRYFEGSKKPSSSASPPPKRSSSAGDPNKPNLMAEPAPSKWCFFPGLSQQEKKGEKATMVKSEPIGSVGAPAPGAAPEQGGTQPAAYE